MAALVYQSRSQQSAESGMCKRVLSMSDRSPFSEATASTSCFGFSACANRPIDSLDPDSTD